MSNAPVSYAQAHQSDFVSDLETLLRIPSVSTDPAHADDVEAAANWLAEHFRELGVSDVEVWPTDGHPVVYAAHHPHDNAPTVLVYGHYDVQPPDPLDEWDYPPFEPTRVNGDLVARGSCDDKGQMLMHVKALESYLKSDTTPPVNLTFLIEGEEEVGSKHLPDVLDTYADRLDADLVVVSDTSMLAEGQPTVVYGLRGLAYLEVTLQGPNRDLHSGLYGGAVENPINALSQMLADLHDDDHRVTIPGFYDAVRPLTDDERTTIANLPFDEAHWLDEIGLNAARTENGYSILEAISVRPTLDVNGIWGGYTGEGAKTVLPAAAHAKVSMRLVPDQEPAAIYDAFEACLQARVPDTMTLTVDRLHGGQPVLVEPDQPIMQAAAAALNTTFDRETVFVRHGGSIPIIADFQQRLGLDSVLMGFGLESDAIHSPNEKFGLDRYAKGIETIIQYYPELAKRLAP